MKLCSSFIVISTLLPFAGCNRGDDHATDVQSQLSLETSRVVQQNDHYTLFSVPSSQPEIWGIPLEVFHKGQQKYLDVQAAGAKLVLDVHGKQKALSFPLQVMILPKVNDRARWSLSPENKNLVFSILQSYRESHLQLFLHLPTPQELVVIPVKFEHLAKPNEPFLASSTHLKTVAGKKHLESVQLYLEPNKKVKCEKSSIEVPASLDSTDLALAHLSGKQNICRRSFYPAQGFLGSLIDGGSLVVKQDSTQSTSSLVRTQVNINRPSSFCSSDDGLYPDKLNRWISFLDENMVLLPTSDLKTLEVIDLRSARVLASKTFEQKITSFSFVHRNLKKMFGGHAIVRQTGALLHEPIQLSREGNLVKFVFGIHVHLENESTRVVGLTTSLPAEKEKLATDGKTFSDGATSPSIAFGDLSPEALSIAELRAHRRLKDTSSDLSLPIIARDYLKGYQECLETTVSGIFVCWKPTGGAKIVEVYPTPTELELTCESDVADPAKAIWLH